MVNGAEFEQGQVCVTHKLLMVTNREPIGKVTRKQLAQSPISCLLVIHKLLAPPSAVNGLLVTVLFAYRSNRENTVASLSVTVASRNLTFPNSGLS